LFGGHHFSKNVFKRTNGAVKLTSLLVDAFFENRSDESRTCTVSERGRCVKEPR
jgi:hypothetical protein